MLSQPYMNPMGSFVVDWLVNLCCHYPAPNLVKPSKPWILRSCCCSVCWVPKKNTTHTPPQLTRIQQIRRKKTHILQTTKKHSNQPTSPYTNPSNSDTVAILYHPKTRTMSLAESRSNLGFSPPRWLFERSQFDEGCYRWVLLENALRLKRHFCKKSGSSGMGNK